MQPWKMFIRSASVVTLLTVGGFAAGQSVVPFINSSRTTAPSVEEDAPETEAPAVDPAAEVDDSTTTTTTTEAPKADDPSDDPVADPKPAVDETTTTTTAAPAPVEVTEAPSAPAPAVAPKTKKPKKEKGDHNCDGHADNGWLKNKPDNKTYPSGKKCPAPTSAPAAATPATPDKGRSDTAPGQVYRDDRPEGAPGQVEGHESNRPDSAPGQMKKTV